jgi:hypothetical protein
MQKSYTPGRRLFVPKGFKSKEMARPERFELPTLWFVATRSIQLSYGRVKSDIFAVSCALSP